MTEVLFHVAGGRVFLGLGACLLIVLAAGFFVRGEAGARWFLLAVLAGVAGMLISAPALPRGVLPLWALLAIGGLAEGHWRARRGRRLSGPAAVVLALATCGLMLVELPYQRVPELAAPVSVHVVGDSLSAGIGLESFTWPERLEELTGVPVTNSARPGARLADGMAQLRAVEGEETLVLVLLGGNDILLRRPRAEFERDLRALLEALTENGRRAVMFELPVVAGYRPYGRVQRRLVREYDVPLIPARVLSRVLSAPDGTSDGIHLTDEGHRLLADRVAGLLGFD